MSGVRSPLRPLREDTCTGPPEALFALAAAATRALGDEDGRRAAHAAVPLVCRTGTHLFLFAGYLEQFGGWGRGTRRAIGNWYADPERSVTDIAYQAVKYRRCEGWVHRDLLRLSHPRTDEPVRRQLFDWISGRTISAGCPWRQPSNGRRPPPPPLRSVNLSRATMWEMIPDRFLNEPSVWEALLQNGLPQGALMRQLPRLTRLGPLEPMGQWAGPVAAQLADPKRLRKAHMHPINVLVAQRTYASGRSARGEGMWSPSRPIVDALDAAFYAAFGVAGPGHRSYGVPIRDRRVHGARWHVVRERHRTDTPRHRTKAATRRCSQDR
jgi:60 kDa SS-A/Ro ribonucleoprotein